MEGSRPGETRIGAALSEARARAGLEILEVEERTKVRAKYLRALEEENWEELPSTAYAKAFLRTYANALELDAEHLVDEFRRQVEAGEEPGRLGEGVLEHRRRLAGPSRRVNPVGATLALIAVVGAGIAVIALAGDDGEDPAPVSRDSPKKGAERERPAQDASTGELLRLELRVRKPVEVCLLGAGRQELIDGQLLAAGSRDAFASERFVLRFPAGFDRDQVELELDGKRAELPRIDGPAALRIAPPRRVRQASPPGERCP